MDITNFVYSRNTKPLKSIADKFRLIVDCESLAINNLCKIIAIFFVDRAHKYSL